MVAQRVKVAVAEGRLTNQQAISVIIPILNEGEGLANFLQKLSLFTGSDIELIFVDGGSQDDSLKQLEQFKKANTNVQISFSSKGRAVQMNRGAALAKGELLLFLHADSYLPLTAQNDLGLFYKSGHQWGRFDVKLNNSQWPFKIISWFINQRSRLTGISTGDQGIFVRRKIFDLLGGFPEQPLMEDVQLCIQLKIIGKPYRIKNALLSSARKWEQEGIVSTVWLMWKLRAAYARGVSPEILVKQYYPSPNKI